MYKEFFGLERDPFAMTPDPAVMLMTLAQREALAGMVYGILARKGFVVISGEAGTGKTTLLNKIMRTLTETRAHFSVVFNPTLSPAEFLESALADFGVKEIPASKARRLMLLHDLLLECDRKDQICVLIVDEAHKLNAEVLEEIRLLSNFEKPDRKLLQIILVGQPELEDLLDRDDLRQLKQRLAVRLRIGRMRPLEVQCYIGHRWKAAGGKQHPFEAAAVEQITGFSKGIPRVINSLCDNALMLAMGYGSHVVTADHVLEAAGDLVLGEPVRTAVPQTSTAAQPIPIPATAAREPAVVNMPTLERYVEPAINGSFVSRLFGKFRVAN